MTGKRTIPAVLFVCLILLQAVSWADDTQGASPVSPTVAPSAATLPGQDAGDLTTMTDIVDIKPPKDIGFDPRIITWALILVAGIVFVLLAFFLMDRFLKKRKTKYRDLAEIIPADVWALEALTGLEKDGFNDPRMFYFSLTAILKGYLEGRFGLDAPEMTTEELLPAINSLALDSENTQSLKELFKRSDPVKFAGMSQNREQMLGDFEIARSFVNQTRKAPSDEEAA